MGEAKHTPGPWTVWPAFPGTVFAGAKIDTAAIVADRAGADPETVANARLIAAAPDLLEALQVIVANARIQPDAGLSGATDIYYAIPMDDIEAARAVIAKATGEAQP